MSTSNGLRPFLRSVTAFRLGLLDAKARLWWCAGQTGPSLEPTGYWLEAKHESACAEMIKTGSVASPPSAWEEHGSWGLPKHVDRFPKVHLTEIAGIPDLGDAGFVTLTTAWPPLTCDSLKTAIEGGSGG